MPPYLDIYGLAKQRDVDLITRFLATYTNIETHEDNYGGALCLLALPPFEHQKKGLP